MKNLFTYGKTHCLSLVLIFAFLAFIPKEGKSCIDPDTVITVVTNFNTDFTEVEIRLGNLKLMTEQPNVFCSCALSNFTGFFTYLEYVAFVNTGTNTPYPNMAPWENTPEADNAWNNAQPSFGNWNGFIGDVINNGLAPTDDVELIIRASTPPGLYVSVSDLDSTLSFSYLGTDAWNPATQDLFADHQGIRNLSFDVSSKIYNEVTDEYFANLDNDILSDVEDLKRDLSFAIHPNPSRGDFQVTYHLKESSDTQVNVYTISGQLLFNQTTAQVASGQQVLTIKSPDGLLKNGMYLVEIIGDSERGVQKLLVAQ